MGTPAWKALYHRARNAVEGRNATLEGWGLKRFSVFGLERTKALTFLAFSSLPDLKRLDILLYPLFDDISSSLNFKGLRDSLD